jgi:hypothetical protein
MDRAITRHEVAAALISVLRGHGVANAEEAIEVLGPPNYMVRLFGVILSDAVKPILAPQLARATGRLHPTVGDVWILTEAESLALLGALYKEPARRLSAGSLRSFVPTNLSIFHATLRGCAGFLPASDQIVRVCLASASSSVVSLR